MIKTINALKTLFSLGKQATEDSFSDLIDSFYGKAEDSVLLGPLGLTGTYGLIGPTGGTHRGLIGPSSGNYLGFYYLGGTAPGSSSSSGSTGQIIFSVTGGTGYMYIHSGSQWIKIEGISNF
jgi:hypothetical protein